jgi:peptide/nickel transport system ATP-binding protein
MAELRAREDVSILYITHDLASARYIADRIIVTYAGHIVEVGPTEQVLADPRHPYTKLLLPAVPDPRGPSAEAETADAAEPTQFAACHVALMDARNSSRVPQPAPPAP